MLESPRFGPPPFLYKNLFAPGLKAHHRIHIFIFICIIFACVIFPRPAVSTMIQFVANYDDLSTDRGYQFKFHCDKCYNGYMLRFQPNAIGIARGLSQVASSLFGGLSEAENVAYHIQWAIGGKAHDSALETAVAEGKDYFKQCMRCGH